MRQFFDRFPESAGGRPCAAPKCHHTIGYAQYGSDLSMDGRTNSRFTLTTPPAGAFSASFSTMAISPGRSRIDQEILTCFRRPVRKRKISPCSLRKMIDNLPTAAEILEGIGYQPCLSGRSRRCGRRGRSDVRSYLIGWTQGASSTSSAMRANTRKQPAATASPSIPTTSLGRARPMDQRSGSTERH